MIALDLRPGVRVRQARAPRLHDWQPDSPSRRAALAGLLGRTGTVNSVSANYTAVVRWDDGSFGAWRPDHLELVVGRNR